MSQKAPGPAIVLVAAVADNGVIGRDNALPWHIPEDLKHFKRVTLGKPILMGRRTFDSVGRALPGRTNYVLSRDPDWAAPDAVTVESLAAAIALESESPEFMVVGGQWVYELALPLADRILLTQVHADVDGDVFFPTLSMREWVEIDRRDVPASEGTHPAYSFVTLQRRNASSAKLDLAQAI